MNCDQVMGSWWQGRDFQLAYPHYLYLFGIELCDRIGEEGQLRGETGLI